jgi:outer membrane protein assembly factor BamB
LVADGKVYVGTRRGVFWTFAATREKQVLAEINLRDSIASTPTAANGVLYVTTLTHLYAVESKGDSARVASSGMAN